MGFGNFLRGIVAQVTPSFIDHGQTYGTFNPPQKKKDDQNQFGTPQPAPRPYNPNVNQNPTQPQVQKPQNLFQGLNNDMRLPGAPQNNANPIPGVNLKPSTPPQPGTVYQPNNPTPQIPNQNNTNVQHPGFWHNLTHNPVTNVVGGVGKAVAQPFVQLGKGVGQLPAGIAGDIASMSSDPYTRQAGIDEVRHAQQAAFGTNDSGTIAKKIIGSTAGAMLTVAAPGASKALEAGGAAILPEAAPSVIRAVAPRFLAGATVGGGFNTAATVGQGDTNPMELAKAYTVGGLTGGALDVATPFINRFLPRNWLRNRNTAQAITEAESEAPIEGAATTEALQPQQPQNIPVKAPDTPPVKIPVGTPPTDNPWLIPPIKEIGGDFNFPKAEELQQIRVTKQANDANAFNSNARPDSSVEGIRRPAPTKPYTLNPADVKGSQDEIVKSYASMLKDVGQGNGTQLVPDGEGGYIRTTNNFRNAENGGKRMTNQDWLDQAKKELDSGQAEPGHQQAFNEANNPDVQSLIAQGDQTAQPPVGRPITVKEVKGIPVIDKTEQTTVPAGNVETPGTVRPTTAAAPANDKAAAVAAQPTVTPPQVASPSQIPLPADTQAILDNPKNFTKRQVQSARNQLKLAKKLAKTAEDTAAATDRITNAKPTGDKGFVPTGEFRQGAQGNITESASKATEAAQGAHDTANLSVADVLQQARQEVNDNGVVSPQTVRNLKALRDSGTMSRTSPEFKAVTDEYKNAISHHARALSMTDRTARTTASGDQLTNRFITKLTGYAEDSGKLTDNHIKQIEDAENTFTQARDRATALGEQFKATGDPAAFKAWKAAQQVAEKADRQAKITEYTVSKDALKGNKSLEAAKAVQEAEKNAGVYSMDSIDSNMLSGTGTMVRNYINTLFPRIENKLFGRASSLAVRKLAPIGGSSGRGARIGSKLGADMFKADVAARKEAGVGFIRRTVTAGNTVGERNIQATAYSKAFSHYQQLLKDEGYKGAELKNRAEFNVRTDPDGLVAQYERDTLQANALSGLTHTKKVENVLADGIQKKLADAGVGVKGQQAGRFGAKAVTRVGLGFPTVIARSLGEGFKRATLGLPEAGWATAKYMMTGNKEAFAGDLSKAIQHAGTGASLILVGSALGKMGAISGAYPTDPAERARWEAEGRQENSINIGGQWFNIPGYLGGFALPLMLGATAGSGNIKDEATLKNAWSTVLSASPVDNIQSTLDILTGNSSAAKTKNAATSLVRSMTPAGSFLAEIAKLTDKTANDTTQKDAVHNILDQVAGGIPIVNNAVNKSPKLDSYGNVIKNPNPVATVLGAQGATQAQGTKDVNKEQGASDQTFNEMNGYGVFNDKNLTQLIDPKLYKQMQEGQPVTPQDVQKIQKAVTKGISASEDSNWREAGNYSTDKAALQVKLQMLNADPTTKPSEKQQYQVQIKRDDVLQSHNIPYDALKQYESTSLSQWRDMGDPYSQSYDPDTYQKLWAVDQLMAKGGASYKTGDPTSQKFSAKQPGSGRSGGRRGNSVTGDFGKLGNTTGAPQVQKYATIDRQAGNMPIITPVRPNIVHNISSSG